ncbi:11853_t:CDS:2, partial [Dentiscutata heterogama]
TQKQKKQNLARFPSIIPKSRGCYCNSIAEDDLKSPGELRMLLQQIKEKRENKIRIGLANLEPIPHKINNISAREIHIMRPTFVMVFDSLRRIQETTLKQSSGRNLSEATRRTVDIMN